MKFVTEHYIQHYPNASDGRKAAIAMPEQKFSNAALQFSIKELMVDENTAAIHLQGIVSPYRPGVAVVEMYRIQDKNS